MKGEEFRIPSLDGVRALAALTVFASHLRLRDVIPGGFGVTVFFFLSGYLITTLLRREYEKHGRISLRKFYLRRAFRIWPPLYLVLLILMLPAVNGMEHDYTTPASLTAQFLQYTNYYAIVRGDSYLIPGSWATWSLAVEEHFYLLFPLSMLILLRRFDYRATALALLSVCGLVLVWRCVLVLGFGIGDPYTYLATDTRLDSILYGCVMGLWLNPALDKTVLAASDRTWRVVLAVATGVLLCTFVYRADWFRETLRYSLQGLALAPMFFCAIRYSHWKLFRWLNTPIMRGMGLISYTFYLIHTAAIAFVGRHVGESRLILATLGFGLSVAFAVAMYWLVERRMAAWRRRLHA